MTIVAPYGRISTDDDRQTLETQLVPLREYCVAQGWHVYQEYTDEAPAGDLGRRVRWRELLEDASRRKFDLVLVWRMDRAFRSVLDAATTLERLRGWGVGLRSFQEPYLDTTSPFGEALFHITIAYAQLERGILRERVTAGLDRARRHGTKSGRPIGRPRLEIDVIKVCDALRGRLRERGAVAEVAAQFHVSRAWVYKRALPSLLKEDSDGPA